MNDIALERKRLCGGTDSLSVRPLMNISFDADALRQLVREIVAEVMASGDWPAGRVALDEAEAAEACGVARHVLRDLRLSGKIAARKLGRKIVYTRADVLAAVAAVSEEN